MRPVRFALPSITGGSLSDNSIKILSIFSPVIAAKICSTVCILKPSLDNACHNCAHHNVALARQLGFSDEQLSSISSNSWRENDEFSDKEKAVLDWANATTDMSARIKDDDFRKMTEYFSNSEIVELTYTTALWNCTNRLAEALHITAEPRNKGIHWDKK